MEADIAKIETELKLAREDLQQTIEQVEQKFETGLRFERRLKKNPVIMMCLFSGLGFLYGAMTRKRSLFISAALTTGVLTVAARHYSRATRV
jgi:demethoxyubiquinone hydroxylase (CLK1/Coq7/Cat5 family)